MDAIAERNPIEFQRISQRVITRFNPKRELISTAQELRQRIEKGMRETGNRRASGFLIGRGPELAIEQAKKGVKSFQELLGWVKPKVRKIKLKPPVSKWLVVGYKRVITEHERTIIYYRHKLRELGVKLRPYSAAHIRRLEKEYLKEIGWPGWWKIR